MFSDFVTTVPGKRPNSRGFNMPDLATHPNMSKNETSDSEGQRKEVYYMAQAYYGKRQK
jgi:hypothetical protein